MGQVLPLALGVTPAGNELLERCLLGEADAWRLFYEIHADRLGRFLTRMGVPAADLEDVMQEVFLALYGSLPDYDRCLPFRAWMLGVAMNHVRCYRRRVWRRRVARLGGFGGWQGHDEDPEHVCQVGEAARELQWILSRMSDKQREVFVLYEMEGLDGPSIARILGCPVNTVWSRARLAREDFHSLQRRRKLVRGEEE